MDYIYHAVPKELRGSLLVPLETQKQLYPDLFTQYAQKYEGRKEVVEQPVQLLGCTWSEVVQGLPLPPQKVFDAQVEMGALDPKHAGIKAHMRFYKIPVSKLEPNKAVVFFKTAPGEKYTETKWLQDVNLSDLQSVPPSTLVYFKMCAEFKQPPFNFQFIPHVLYQGTIDISDCEIVEVALS